MTQELFHGSRLILILATVSAFVISWSTIEVFAGYPTVSGVVVWNNAGNTVLNITVFHLPQSSTHHLDYVDINVSGNIRTFPVAFQSQTTFVVTCDLGPIAGTPQATVRPHCNIDGYSISPYGPIQVPELSLAIMLVILIVAVCTVIASHRIRQ